MVIRWLRLCSATFNQLRADDRSCTSGVKMTATLAVTTPGRAGVNLVPVKAGINEYDFFKV